MTWQPWSAVARGTVHIALAVVVVASVCAGTTQVRAIELGELQAVPSSAPPYIFRLPIITLQHGPSVITAVTVRQPPDVLSLVKENVIELRLRRLTDIELEVSQGRQTLNRLLLKSELQAARMRLEAATASNLPQPDRARGRDRPIAEAMPLIPAPEEVADRSRLEHEITWIRQEIQHLVGRVTPWEGIAPPAERMQQDRTTGVVPLLLGGLLIAGVTGLAMGYVMQRHTINRERRRRRTLTVSIRRLQDQLAEGVPLVPAEPLAPRSRAAPRVLEPVTVLRRLRVSHKTKRRVRLRTESTRDDAMRERADDHLQQVARTSYHVPSSPVELMEALARLRRELMRLQGKAPTPVNPRSIDVGSGQASHEPRGS